MDVWVPKSHWFFEVHFDALEQSLLEQWLETLRPILQDQYQPVFDSYILVYIYGWLHGFNGCLRFFFSHIKPTFLVFCFSFCADPGWDAGLWKPAAGEYSSLTHLTQGRCGAPTKAHLPLSQAGCTLEKTLDSFFRFVWERKFRWRQASFFYFYKRQVRSNFGSAHLGFLDHAHCRCHIIRI